MNQSAEPTVASELGVSSLALGLFALLVFWWFPLGVILSAAGLTLGLAALGAGGRERRSLGAVLVCAAALGAALASAWGTYVRLFGFSS